MTQRMLMTLLVLTFGLASAAHGEKRIYWSNGAFGTIERSALNGSGRQTIRSGESRPNSLALDLVNNKIYWTETDGNRIRRANLDGSSPETIQTATQPEGIAVDPAGGKVYWTLLNGHVHRANLDGTSPASIGLPARGIALDLVNQKIYLSEPGVTMADLDGSNPQTVVNDGSEDQLWVAVNPTEGKIYFSSTGNGNRRIVRANLNGSGQEWSFLIDEFGNLDDFPSGIAADPVSGQIYWREGAFTTSRIRRAEADGGSRVNVVNFSMIYGGIGLDLRNTAPVASGLEISPPYPTTDSDLAGSYQYSDSDGEAESGSQIRWYRDSALVPTLNDLLTVPASETTNGEQWYLVVQPSDGISSGAAVTSSTVTIENLAPSASNLMLTPSQPGPAHDLAAAYVFTDLNGDIQSGSEVRWFRDGQAEPTWNDTLTVSSAATSEGEQWLFVVRPSDGALFGATVTSTAVTVENLAPAASSVALSPAPPDLNEDLVASYSFSDPNGDSESGSEVRWFRDGLPAAFDDQSTVPALATSADEVWHFTVRPSDGTMFGNLQQSNSVTIGSACTPTAVVVDFKAMGTFTTAVLVGGTASITATTSVGVPGTLNLLNLNGLGVVGGSNATVVDTNEGVLFSFAGVVEDVSYSLSSAGNTNGNGTVGDAFIEAFDAAGASLGVVAISGSGSRDVSGIFGDQVLSAFEIRADGDPQRIGTLQYRPSSAISFAAQQFTFGEDGVPVDTEVTLLRTGSDECPSTVLIDVVGGTATAGVDFDDSAFPMVVRFGPSQTMTTAAMPVFQDSIEEATEQIDLQLVFVDTAFAQPDSASVDIIDDDVVQPSVTEIRAIGSTVTSTVTACGTVLHHVESIGVVFDEAMDDSAGGSAANDVSNPANYLLVRPATVASGFDTVDCSGNTGLDLVVPVLGVAYDEIGLTSSLDTGPLEDGLHRLIVCATLRDLVGSSLTGGDLLLDLRIDQENLLTNGHLDHCGGVADIQPWVEIAPHPADISHSIIDAQQSPLSGSVYVENPLGGAVLSINQCVPVDGKNFLHSVSARVDVTAPAEVELEAFCAFFPLPSCAGSMLGSAVATQTFDSSMTGLWQSVSGRISLPQVSASASCIFSFAPAGADFDGYLDHLVLSAEPVLFDDGFESGSTVAWSGSVP